MKKEDIEKEALKRSVPKFDVTKGLKEFHTRHNIPLGEITIKRPPDQPNNWFATVIYSGS